MDAAPKLTTQQVLFKLEGIWKSYGAIKVLEDISLEVEQGTSLCVLGPSGCGKSTLLKLVGLIIKPDKGVFLINGVNTTTLSDAQLYALRREKIAYSFQESLLLPYMTALENVVDIVSSPKDATARLLEDLGLGGRLNHKPSKLSVGEKKRVDLARALMKGSQVLVADEPFSNLDPETAGKVLVQFKEYVKKGNTIVYSSVGPEEAKYANSTLDMKKIP